MPSALLRIFMAALLALALGACAPKAARDATSGSPGSPWPDEPDVGRLFYVPRFMGTPQKATQALWDQRSAYTLSGAQVVEIDPSQRILRITGQVKRTRNTAVYPPGTRLRRGCANPSSVLCDEYPYYTEQTYYERRTAVIPLDRMDDLALYESGAIRIRHEGSRLTELLAASREAQYLVADALATLATPLGFKPGISPGLAIGDMTLAQRMQAGQNGILILSVDRLGPADRAGLRYLDLITAVDGKPLDAAKLMARLSLLEKPGAPALKLDVYRWRTDPKDPLDKPGPFQTELRGSWAAAR